MKNKKKREAAKKKKDEANVIVETTVEKTSVEATGDPEKDKKIRNISKVR